MPPDPREASAGIAGVEELVGRTDGRAVTILAHSAC